MSQDSSLLDVDTLKQMLVLDEANKQFPYRDSVGKLTIGVGRNLSDKGLSQDEIQLLLHNDIREVENELENLAWFPMLDDVRKLVIADMAFNLGLPRLLGFKKTIRAIRTAHFKAAADEMLDSKWARQVGKRAERLAFMMRTGELHTAYLGGG